MQDLNRLKRYKPTSPGIRGKVRVDKSCLSKEKPVRSLVISRSSSGGKNNLGRLTSRRFKGNGKKRLRVVDLHPSYDYVVERLEYDPHRSSRLALVRTAEGQLKYVVASDGMHVGQEVKHNVRESYARVKLGDLRNGDNVCMLSYDKYGKAQLIRSAGTYGVISATEEGRKLITLPSGERRYFNDDCWVNLSRVSNVNHRNEVDGKAGVARRRPVTRGMAQSCVDHPMGSNSGKIKGRIPKTK